MKGQINLFDYLAGIPDFTLIGCGHCICKECLYWWSDRCPNSKCFDDKRAVDNPYDKAYPDKSPRTGWSNWKTDQAYWCRGGTHYPAYKCERFEKYLGRRIEECIRCNVLIYQDGYMECSLVDNLGCEVCYEGLVQKMDELEIG